MGDAIYLTRNLVGQTVTVGTTPTLLIRSSYAWPFMVLNPSRSLGLTTVVTGFSGTATDGDVTAGIGVAGFEQVHLHLNVTDAGASTYTITTQTYDAVSLQWIDSQDVFTGVSAIGSQYADIGSLGVATDLRFKFTRTVGVGNITCSIGVVLKNGIGGSSAGLAQTVFLGGPNVTTVSGFPLLEGNRQTFIIGENVELWGVAYTNIDVRIFML
jgi:hypothetical protein